MPNPNNTLEAELLKKATYIGPTPKARAYQDLLRRSDPSLPTLEQLLVGRGVNSGVRGMINLPKDPNKVNDPMKSLSKATSIGPQAKNAFGQDLPIPEAKDPILQGGEMLKGLMGFGSGHGANGIGQIVNAGVPFIAPMGKVFHGAPEVFEHFNPSLNVEDDTFGKMTHFAEKPEYAEGFANKMGDPTNPHPWARERSRKAAPNIIPAKLDVKNAIDITDGADVDMLKQDIHKILPHLDPSTRFYLEDSVRRNGMKPYEILSPLDVAVRKDPNLLNKAGFDGIRYMDGANPAWAVPSPSQAKTPWGTPLHIEGPMLPKAPPKSFSEEMGVGKKIPINDGNPDTYKEQAVSLADYMKKVKLPTPEVPMYEFKHYGKLSEREAAQLVNNGDIPIKEFENKFGHTKGIDHYYTNKPAEPKAYFDKFGKLTKTEAGHLVGGGELSMSEYAKEFGYETPIEPPEASHWKDNWK